MPSSPDEPALPEYTLRELAEKTGVPSRTIRFYQAKGVLPPPRKRGRVAVYDDSHVERLAVIAELQDRGLRLRAIRDVVCRGERGSEEVRKWFGIGEQIGALNDDPPQLLTEGELFARLGQPAPGVLRRLEQRGAIQRQGQGEQRRYLVQSPALLALGKRLLDAGVDIETAIALHEILQRRLARAARELVAFSTQKVGRGFGRSASPDDVIAAVEAVFQGGVGADAVRLIFRKELERAVQEALPVDVNRSRRRATRS